MSFHGSRSRGQRVPPLVPSLNNLGTLAGPRSLLLARYRGPHPPTHQYQGWSHRETIGTACHGSARASSSNWTFPLCRCRTAIIKGGTTLTSGFTVAPASRSNWTRCELPSSTANSNIVVGCCFGGRMLGSARACKSRCVRLTPGRGNRKSLEA